MRDSAFSWVLLLLLLRLQTQIIGGDVTEGFLPILHEGLGDELIHILRKEQHIVALLTEGLHLGQLGQTVLALAGGKRHLLLAFGHGVHIGLGDSPASLPDRKMQK